MNNFPKIDITEAEKDQAWTIEYIDAVVDYHDKSSSDREAVFNNIYDSYNGVRKSVAKTYLTKRYGKPSSVPFLRYNYGRTKTKVLFGEMLDFKFNATIEAINVHAKNEKMHNRAVMSGAMNVKGELESVKKNFGFNVLNGAEVPEKDDPAAEEKISPRLPIEMFLQIVLEDKIDSEKLLQRAYEFFTDLVIVSECHGIVRRDPYDNDSVEFIPAKESIFMETPNDPFCERSPFHGQKQWMYLHQIMTKWPSLSEKEIEDIKSCNHQAEKDITRNIGGETAYPVYYVEFFSPRPYYTKISPAKNSDVPYELDMDPEWYQDKKNKKKIDREVKNGKYGMETMYGEQIHKGYRIGYNVYVEVERKKDVIQIKRGGKYRAQSDFIHLLFGTVNGIRISVQELVYNLDEVYDVIMWQIVREIRKMKGSVLVYDEALTPKHSDFETVMFDMTEEGVVKINTMEEGNYYSRDVLNAAELVKQLDLGPGTTLNDLVGIKIAIEKTIDRITGINDEREGLGTAYATATTNMANLEASRNITKDIYFYLNEFMEKVLLKLLEKVKMNSDYLQKFTTKFKYGDNMVTFAKILEEIPLSEIGLKLTDGKMVEEVKSKVRHLFAQEVNSGQLRTMDVIKFEIAKSIGQGVMVLEQGWKTAQAAANAQNESREQIAAKQNETNIELAREDREDRQAHEVELKEMDLQSDGVKAGLKAGEASEKNKIMKEKDKEQNKGEGEENKF